MREDHAASKVREITRLRLEFLIERSAELSVKQRRSAGSLSGGEAQRIRLATPKIGSGTHRGAVRCSMEKAEHRPPPA
jgi:excinuclease UvrABC ATPase subunit